ncbi:GMC family oxidoreductase N-terminal domain-containing protein [Achromobacter pulmonis]|uniref:GMC family oxidoreductase N-terminal domain-containing protein n=1 Tax=Achromobacter pulmonis TaxID=1389932 RepID=UPI003AFFC542
MNAFLGACESSGLPRTSDYNGPRYEGADYLQFNRRHGRRWNTREAYLRLLVLSGGMELRSYALVLRVLFKGHVVGVQYWQDGDLRTVRCRREVILSAGALQ